MKLTCYGTAAAEAIPALYCSCAVCEAARRVGGKEIRTRHSSTVDGDIQFDLGPDFLYHVQNLGLEPRNITTLMISHAHEDHFIPSQIRLRQPPFSLTPLSRLKVIANPQVLSMLVDDPDCAERCNMELITAVAFETIVIDAHTRVTPLPANHGQTVGGCMLYLLERDGKKLLYAHDTGIFPPEVYAYLAGKQIDAITLDCTGAFRDAGTSHLTIARCAETFDALLASGALKPGAVRIINHFSHGGGGTHDQIDADAKSRGWIAAYDGIQIEV